MAINTSKRPYVNVVGQRVEQKTHITEPNMIVLLVEKERKKRLSF